MCGSFVYVVYFLSYTRWKRRRKKKNNNKIEIFALDFALDFLDYEEKSWESGGVFDIRIAKGFHL